MKSPQELDCLAFALFVLECREHPELDSATPPDDEILNTLRLIVQFLHQRACGLDVPVPDYINNAIAAVRAGSAIGEAQMASRRRD